MPQFWLFALGHLCVAVNLAINGIGILLPTCFGYAIVAGASWSLRDDQRSFLFATLPSVALALLTFPDLFRGAVADGLVSYDDWTLWPVLLLEAALTALIAYGL